MAISTSLWRCVCPTSELDWLPLVYIEAWRSLLQHVLMEDEGNTYDKGSRCLSQCWHTIHLLWPQLLNLLPSPPSANSYGLFLPWDFAMLVASVVIRTYRSTCITVKVLYSPEKRWCYSTDDCHSFIDDISIVEYIPRHIVIRCDTSASCG